MVKGNSRESSKAGKSRLTVATNKRSCDRCGTCCRHGGPALHLQDRSLVESGVISRTGLVAIRCGELVNHPLAAQPVVVRQEFLKIRGRNGSWICGFFNEERAACGIYESRPHSCELLKCWQPEEALAMIGQRLLGRFDLIADDDPLLPVVRLHEQQCPCPDLHEVDQLLRSDVQRGKILASLTELVNRDLVLRGQTVTRYGLSLGLELFYFGRPLFQVLAGVGITGVDSAAGVVLRYEPGHCTGGRRSGF